MSSDSGPFSGVFINIRLFLRYSPPSSVQILYDRGVFACSVITPGFQRLPICTLIRFFSLKWVGAWHADQNSAFVSLA